MDIPESEMSQESSLPEPIIQKKRFSKLAIFGWIVFIIIVAVYAWTIITVALSAADEAATGSWALLGTILLYPILSAISVAGLIIGLLMLGNKKVILGCLLLLFSVISAPSVWDFTGFSLGKMISPTFVPYMKNRADVAYKRDQELYKNEKEQDYAYFSQKFQNPQKITKVLRDHLATSENIELYLYGERTLEDANNFEKYAQDFLIGKSVVVKLPSYDDFMNHYIPGMEGKLTDTTKVVPVLVYVDGVLIDEKYSSLAYPSTFDKYKSLP